MAENEEIVKDELENNEQPVKKKRGRKPSKDKKNKYYFSEAEEQAVLAYIKTDSAVEKNIIYVKTLKPVFEKMVESIMRRYNKYVPNEDTGDTLNDTISFLLTKLDKFDVSRNKKAYSYYGNICKNYITGKIQTYNKCLIRNPSYDDETNEVDIINNYANKSIDRGKIVASEIVKKLISHFNEMCENPDKFSLKESEVKLSKALVNLFENWDYVISSDGSNKLNKNAILFFLREQTGLDTKGIRDNMKKFKKEYLIIKDFIINN